MRPPEDRPLYPKYLKLKRGADLFQNHVDVNFIILLEAFEVTYCFFKIKIIRHFWRRTCLPLCDMLGIGFDFCEGKIEYIDN